MDQLVHVLTTLWVYAHRDRYQQQIAVELAELDAQMHGADAAGLAVLENRRRVLMAERNSLASPLRWNSLAMKASIQAEGTVDAPSAPDTSYAEAA